MKMDSYVVTYMLNNNSNNNDFSYTVQEVEDSVFSMSTYNKLDYPAMSVGS